MLRYASEKISQLEAQANIRQQSRFRKWTPLTPEEFLGFLAIVLNMGVIYWKTSWESQIPFFGRVMP